MLTDEKGTTEVESTAITSPAQTLEFFNKSLFIRIRLATLNEELDISDSSAAMVVNVLVLKFMITSTTYLSQPNFVHREYMVACYYVIIV